MGRWYFLILIVAAAMITFIAYSFIREPLAGPLIPGLSSHTEGAPETATSQPGADTGPDSPRYTGSSSGGGGAGSSSAATSTPVESEDQSYEPHYCIPESRGIECDESQDVVCGWFSNQQSTCDGPCVKLFVNTCQACSDDRVEYWTNGDCPIHG